MAGLKLTMYALPVTVANLGRMQRAVCFLNFPFATAAERTALKQGTMTIANLKAAYPQYAAGIDLLCDSWSVLYAVNSANPTHYSGQGECDDTTWPRLQEVLLLAPAGFRYLVIDVDSGQLFDTNIVALQPYINQVKTLHELLALINAKQWSPH
jgi:hypothetical protein